MSGALIPVLYLILGILLAVSGTGILTSALVLILVFAIGLVSYLEGCDK